MVARPKRAETTAGQAFGRVHLLNRLIRQGLAVPSLSPMNRIVLVAIVAIALAACATTTVETGEPSTSDAPTPLPSGQVEVVAHCGLDWVRIEYDGSIWRFEVPDQDGPPEGWLDFQTVEIIAGESGPVVVGPDGLEWALVPADPEETPGMCF